MGACTADNEQFARYLRTDNDCCTATLIKKAAPAMLPRKLPSLAILLVTAIFEAPGHQAMAQGQPGAEPQARTPPIALTCPDPHRGKPARLDLHGDPLPEGAIGRLGTVRLRHGYLHSGLAFSGDGKSVIASDYYGGVHVWDAADGRELRQFCESDYYCHGLAVSPDGRTLAVAIGHLTVRLFDPNSGRELGSLPQAGDPVNAMTFSHDGTLLATSSGNGPVRVYDVATRQVVHRVQFPDYVGFLAFSPDGKVLVGGGKKGVGLREVAGGKEVTRLKHDSDQSLYAAVAAKAGTIAVWGYDDASVRLFDASGVKELRRFHPDGGPAKKSPDAWGWGIRIGASFSPDGKTLAIAREAGRIDLWDADNGKKLHTLLSDSANRASHLAFSPDGTKLATTGSDNWGGDNTVRVWDVATGKELRPRDGHGSPISSIAFSPTGNNIATAGRDGAVHLWKASSGKHLVRLDGHRGRGPQVSFSSDGRWLISWGSYGSEGALRIWDSAGQLVRQLDQQGTDSFWETVSVDGKTAISVDLKGRIVRFHDLTTGKVSREGADDVQRPMALSPAGDKFVSIYGTLINVADRKELLKVHGAYTGARSIWFSQDGRTLVAAVIPERTLKSAMSNPPAEEVAVFDLAHGKELRRFGMSGEKYRAIHTVALSRDGKTIATVRNSEEMPGEQVVTLWETETGRERGHFLGHRGKVHALDMSADGHLVVSGGDDTTALVWDATRPRTQRVIRITAAAADISARFKDLTSDDAEQAYASIWALVKAPKETVSFLTDQRTLFEATDVAKIERWIADLDSNKFVERERASQELGLVLDEAEEHLKKARLGTQSAEARRRIDQLLQAKTTGFTGKKLQTFRAIEILEHIATPETEGPAAGPTGLAAISLLKKVAAGPAEARMTREAVAALDRVERPVAFRR
jgi:WD40 repeat protein